jgi:hypothetical protein
MSEILLAKALAGCVVKETPAAAAVMAAVTSRASRLLLLLGAATTTPTGRGGEVPSLTVERQGSALRPLTLRKKALHSRAAAIVFMFIILLPNCRCIT